MPADSSVAPSCLSWPRCRRKAGRNRETSGPADRESGEPGGPVIWCSPESSQCETCSNRNTSGRPGPGRETAGRRSWWRWGSRGCCSSVLGNWTCSESRSHQPCLSCSPWRYSGATYSRQYFIFYIVFYDNSYICIIKRSSALFLTVSDCSCSLQCSFNTTTTHRNTNILEAGLFKFIIISVCCFYQHTMWQCDSVTPPQYPQ